MGHDSPRTLSSVSKALDIINGLWELDSAGVTQLADHLDMSTSTVHLHLQTLQSKGYVISEEGTYTLGLRFINFGEYVKQQQPIYQVAMPIADTLAEETNERVYLVAEQYGLLTVLYSGEGSQSVDLDTRVGSHVYMHCSAGGKAILSQLPDDYVEEVVNRWGLKRFTEHTITDRETLYEDLERTRERGYSICRGEYTANQGSIGTPIMYQSKVYGAMTIIGPASDSWFQRIDNELSSQLLTMAKRAELNLESSLS